MKPLGVLSKLQKSTPVLDPVLVHLELKNILPTAFFVSQQRGRGGVKEKKARKGKRREGRKRRGGKGTGLAPTFNS